MLNKLKNFLTGLWSAVSSSRLWWLYCHILTAALAALLCWFAPVQIPVAIYKVVLALGAGLAGYGSVHTHDKEMTATKGENSGFMPEIFRGAHFGHSGYFNKLRHFRREFVGISLIQMSNLSSVRIPQSAGKFGGTNPKAVLVGDWCQSDILERKGGSHGKPHRFFE